MSDEERIEQLELEVKLLRANNKGLKDKIDEQSNKIEELKNADLTTVYLNGVYDGEKKVKDKIKAKIEEIDKVLNEDIYVIDGYYDDRYYRYWQDKHILQELLEKEYIYENKQINRKFN